MMNILDQLYKSFFSFIHTTYNLTPKDTRAVTLTLNVDENKQQFGDINANAALVLAKKLNRNPREIAQEIASGFQNNDIEKIEIAGPGFLNIFLTNNSFITLAQNLFTHPQESFKLSDDAPRYTYNLEFVSANPTGPLHLGHGRGGIIGDVLGNILNFIGHTTIKEYYINDAGSQMQKLGSSFKVRCLQELGHDIEFPEDGYRGAYLQELAKTCVTTHGTALIDKPDTFFVEYAEKAMLNKIKGTLSDYGIEFDVWFSERTLHESGAISTALDRLTKNGYTYEQDDALWFTSERLGDDKDRVLRKSNGDLTYAAADVAYMENKINRGADRLVMILGQDHHSYKVRLKGIAQALGYNPDILNIILYQLVTIKETGKQLRMSKRAGTMVTLREVIDTVGEDVARFFYLNRKADAHLDFDIDLALKKTDENPVYYVQYAYVRTKSILHKASEHPQLADISLDDGQHLDASEHLLLKKIIFLKEQLESISTNNQTHLLTYYVIELAQLFHAYYSKNRVIDLDAIPQSRARLMLITLLKNTFELVLTLLGISKPEKM